MNQFDRLARFLESNGAAVGQRVPLVVASVYQTGLNLMRDLERRGVCAIGVDCDRSNPGFRSKYGLSLVCPDPDRSPHEWFEFMISLSSAIGQKPVLVAAADLYVAAIGRHAKALREHFIFSEKGCILQAALTPKEKQYAIAREYGLPSPQSAYVEDIDELRRFAKEARFPVLLKPRSHREWQVLANDHPFRSVKTVSSKSPEELSANYEKIRSYIPRAVLQEEIVGPDSSKYCYLSVYAQDGHRINACVVQELRAYPLLYGCATLVEPVIDQEIDDVCNQFLLAIGFVGLCEIELKRDARDGKLLLVEINPRFSGTGDCARYAGLELGYDHYLDLIGKMPPTIAPSRFNFRHAMLVADLTAFPIYLSEGKITWRQWLQSLSGPLEFFDFDTSDFRNACSTIFRGIKALLGGLLRCWRLRK
jgi:D-aspartate ligase